jgi:hypothetical protein
VFLVPYSGKEEIGDVFDRMSKIINAALGY